MLSKDLAGTTKQGWILAFVSNEFRITKNKNKGLITFWEVLITPKNDLWTPIFLLVLWY